MKTSYFVGWIIHESDPAEPDVAVGARHRN